MKERVIKYIKTKFDTSHVNDIIDEAKADYLEEGWQDDFDDEHEAYIEQGRGEAELDALTTIKDDVLGELGFGEARFEFETGVNILDLIISIHPTLDV